MGVITWSPLAAGWLTGKYRAETGIVVPDVTLNAPDAGWLSPAITDPSARRLATRPPLRSANKTIFIPNGRGRLYRRRVTPVRSSTSWFRHKAAGCNFA